MSQTTRSPRYYYRGSWSRAFEGIFRYRGGAGQWAWKLHRLTGLGILFYLVAHITDTFFVVVSPAMYDHTMKLYGGFLDGHYYWPLRWVVRLGELGLIACVLFHSINGLRIVLFDFWPAAAQHQRTLFRLVVIVFWTIMILVAIWVVMPLAETPEGAEPAGPPGAAAAAR